MGTTSFLSALLLLVASNNVHYGTCSLPSDNSYGIKNRPQELSSANSDFAIRLTTALGTPGLKNTFFSPYSISSAMGMVYAGASGRTATEIANTFNFGSKNDVQLAYQKHYDAINAHGNEYSLSTANGLFVQSGFTLLQSYKDVLSTYFHAAAKELDFIQQSEPSRQEINSWVESQTQNMIKDLFKSGTITSDTRLVLANAIYFKGTWKTLFPAASTKSEPFKISETDVGSTVPMMNVVSKFNIKRVNELDAKVIQLPYSGNDLSMLIFLPNEYDGLPKLLSSLKASHFSTDGMREIKVNVKLPKFKLETEINLKDVLQSMGIVDLFTTRADFRVSEDRKLKVDTAVHKAILEVDEKGTTAAAATGFGMVAYSLIDFEETMDFHADHPFACAIIHHATNAVLFFGVYATPDTSQIAYTGPTRQRPNVQQTLRPQVPVWPSTSFTTPGYPVEITNVVTTCACIPKIYFRKCFCEVGPAAASTPTSAQRTSQNVRYNTPPRPATTQTFYNGQQKYEQQPEILPDTRRNYPWYRFLMQIGK